MKMHEDPPAEISHSAHPAHKLKLVNTTTDGPPFRCDGCKEPGSGKWRRYRCNDCEFDLHIDCALHESTLKHPLFGDLEFEFIRHAPAPSVDAKFCIACGSITPGFVYHCSGKDIDLHPCCAALKMESFLQDGHVLQLCKEAKQSCVICGEKARPPSSSSHKKFWASFRKEKLWAYRWHYDGNEGYLHVACMKKVAVHNWERAYEGSAAGAIVEESLPIMKGMLRWRPAKNTESTQSSIIGLEQAAADIAQAVSDVATSQ
ncbi:hypothetical protein EJB05_07356, partial [Eragrostis curvula]